LRPIKVSIFGPGENSESAHQQGIDDAVLFIEGNRKDNAWFETSAGAPDTNASLLAEEIKCAVKLADLPAAQRQLAEPGDDSNSNQCRNHYFSFSRMAAQAPCPGYDLVTPVSAAPGNLMAAQAPCPGYDLVTPVSAAPCPGYDLVAPVSAAPPVSRMAA
jgi:hypothetical protein